MKYLALEKLNSWNEAFMAMMPVLRQQSLRIADYTKVLFEEACDYLVGKKAPIRIKEQINPRNTEVAYKCGLYHQLGKALLPEEFQQETSKFTQEELQEYRNYTKKGRLLVARLQELSQKNIKHYTNSKQELATTNITWLMIRESCEQHLENFDGSGYPAGLSGNAISPIAQIVGLAKQVDRLASTIRSEEPFDEACEQIFAMSGSLFNPDLLAILKNAQTRCKNIFNKYIFYSNSIPQTIPLVEKRKGRPMGLNMYPLVDGKNRLSALDARPWFEKKETAEEVAIVEEQLVRLNMLNDVQCYFLYEACDMLLRMKNYRLEIPVLVQVFPSFLNEAATTKLEQVFVDQPIDKSKLVLMLDESVFMKEDAEKTNILKEFVRQGVVLGVSNWHPENLTFEKLRKFGITNVCPSADLLSAEDVQGLVNAFVANCFGVYIRSSDDAVKNTLVQLGAKATVNGSVAMADDEVMKRLSEENDNG